MFKVYQYIKFVKWLLNFVFNCPPLEGVRGRSIPPSALRATSPGGGQLDHHAGTGLF